MANPYQLQLPCTVNDLAESFSTLGFDDSFHLIGGGDDHDDDDNKIMQLSLDQVNIHECLGTGAFSTVFSMEIACTLQVQGKVDEGDSLATDTTIGTTIGSSSSKDSGLSSTDSGRYAIKRLRSDICDPQDFKTIMASKDFALEAHLLTVLPRHPNVIRLNAISKDFFSSPEDGFLVLEQLQDTLLSRLNDWQRRSSYQRQYGKVSIWNGSQRKMLAQEQQAVRIRECALGVARAMQHLHQHGILYRDLKPANVGFSAATESGEEVRLFDFGLARLCPGTAHHNQKLYTGATGTIRYMAPEVARCQPYGFTADVYSFGLLLWQICTLRRPYPKLSGDKLMRTVANSGKLPPLRYLASPDMRSLIQACCDQNATARPTFATICKALEQELHVSSTA